MTVSQHSGFAGASLALTLEIHEGARLFVWDGPGDYLELVSPLPPRSRVIKGLDSNTDFVHVFVRARVSLERSLRTLRATLRREAIIWVSWPKENSRIRTDVTEEIVRATARQLGFADHRICAVGEVWSAVRLERVG
ncbi:MAG TPA: hypothetical protein VM764_06450 [Gemmatimonadaceae bacterium]|nr:hypothetical protein [Gemmatimonadaceae bacterium]